MPRLLAHAGALLCALALAAVLCAALRLSALQMVGVWCGLLALGLIVCASRTARLAHQVLALILASVAAVLVVPAYAFAAEGAAPGPSLPIGDWAIEAAKIALSLLIPYAVVWIGKELAQASPAWRKRLTDDRIDRMVRLAGDFALAALEGCAKGRTVPVSLGTAAIVTATARALRSSPGWQVSAAGGPQGIAEKVFRDLPLDPGASVENTLEPALAQLGLRAG